MVKEMKILFISHSFNLPMEEAIAATQLVMALTAGNEGMKHEVFYLGLEWEGNWRVSDKLTFVSSVPGRDISKGVVAACEKYHPDWILTCLSLPEFPGILWSDSFKVPITSYLPIGERVPSLVKPYLHKLERIFAPTEICKALFPSSTEVGIGSIAQRYGLKWEPKTSTLLYKGSNNWTANLGILLDAVPEVRFEEPWNLDLITDLDEPSNQGLLRGMLPMQHVTYSTAYNCQEGLPFYDAALASLVRAVVWPWRTSPLPILLTECEALGVPMAVTEHPTNNQFKDAKKVRERSRVWGAWGRETVTSPFDWARAMEDLLYGKVKQPLVSKPTWFEVAEEIVSCLN